MHASGVSDPPSDVRCPRVFISTAEGRGGAVRECVRGCVRGGVVDVDVDVDVDVYADVDAA